MKSAVYTGMAATLSALASAGTTVQCGNLCTSIGGATGSHPVCNASHRWQVGANGDSACISGGKNFNAEAGLCIRNTFSNPQTVNDFYNAKGKGVGNNCAKLQGAKFGINTKTHNIGVYFSDGSNSCYYDGDPSKGATQSKDGGYAYCDITRNF